VRSLAAAGGTGPETAEGPPEAYWQNQLVRLNRRIDDASSGRAISISWAARVAIPGVVAILSFMIGLSYYVPEKPRTDDALKAVVQSLPEEAVDSLLGDATRPDLSDVSVDLRAGLFDISSTEVADYMLATGEASTLLESLSDAQVDEVLARLGTRMN
jgi:hypothetical protein